MKLFFSSSEIIGRAGPNTFFIYYYSGLVCSPGATVVVGFKSYLLSYFSC